MTTADHPVVNLVGGIYRRLYSNFPRGRRINSVSVEAECLFWRLHAIADDLGNFQADRTLIKADAAPLRAWSEKAIGGMMAELVAAKLIAEYEVEGEKYAHILDFEALQPAGRNGKRIQRHPVAGASGGIRGNPGESKIIRVHPGESGASDTDTDTEDDTDTESESGNESKTNTPPPRKAGSGVSDADVDAIYAAYPRKVGRAAAIKAIRRSLGILAKRGTADPPGWLLGRVVAYAGSGHVATTDAQYIPHPATWFGQGRYDDDDAAWEAKANGQHAKPAGRRTDGTRGDEYPESIDLTRNIFTPGKPAG